MSRKDKSFNEALMQAIVNKDAVEALKTFQAEFFQSQLTAMGARNAEYIARSKREISEDAYSSDRLSFIEELHQIPEEYEVPLVCYIARMLHQEKGNNPWSLVMAAALHIGADPETQDPVADQTVREMIISSGKGPEVLKHLNETYLPQVHESAVVWPELTVEAPLGDTKSNLPEESGERERERERTITVPAFGATPIVSRPQPAFQFAATDRRTTTNTGETKEGASTPTFGTHSTQE